ncbi:hypothetical protein H6F43_10400 [Leptolyngbya sp. FACHB-36]|uniref:hypothetical protein n=1 Tax=Leptolyngbya sp. FACHB-36 TaxID=2692808 RepID=UPI001680BEAA|nr:hypothetical protein [Leptolyngbya sp. FACHB-36]MBD2020599.1 hypothetical protein [Leptolyngbya sp. FACHB-36]
MSLRGLPDFYQPIQAEECQLFYPYEGGEFVLLPDAIAISQRDESQLDFTLTLVRGQNPNLPPKPYGILDFRLQPRYPTTAALTTLRRLHPQATVQPALFAAGFLQIYPATSINSIPADLTAPIPLAWNGLSTARYSLRVSGTTATLLKEALTSNILQLIARAEMELVGVAPRLPLQVRFKPAELLEPLAALGESRQVACEQIIEFLRRNFTQLPVEFGGDTPNPDEIAVVLLDWIRATYGTAIPAPVNDGNSYIALAIDPSDRVEWNLAHPLQTRRTIGFSLHPLEAAAQVVQAHGVEAVFREAIVPPMPTGAVMVEAAANLPANRLGVLSVGVTLRSPPALPHRPQAVLDSAEFTAPDDRARLRLRLSPVEKPTYRVSTSVVLQDAQGVRQFHSAEILHQGSRLLLQPNQFPVRFLPVSATRSLLSLAAVEGVCRWQEGEMVLSQAFELTAAQPTIALALPPTATNPTLEFTARSTAGKMLHLPAFAAERYQLGLHSFVEYGPQTLQVECEFGQGVPFYAIELLPEQEPETAASLMLLTPGNPRQIWSWFAASPFQSGYRYRPRSEPGSAALPWSLVRSSALPLKLSAQPLGGS